jgi:hypothetical protein
MKVQVYTNTETKSKVKPFGVGNPPFSTERGCVKIYNNGNAYDFSSEVDKLSLWREVCDLHLSEKESILIELTPDTDINEVVQTHENNSVINKLEIFIAEEFLAVPLVEFVFLSIEKHSIDIWTVINKLDRKVREKIYDVEYAIIGLLQNFQFDFHVICRNDRNISEVHPSNAKMIFKKS